MAAALLAASAVCVLTLRGFPHGEALARVPLAQSGFALRYTHSVTRREVESRYAIEAGRIVQTAETFDAHGPGMATEPLTGERLMRDGERYVLVMSRPIERLVVRVQKLPAQSLIADGRPIELLAFGERAIEVAADCAAENR